MLKQPLLYNVYVIVILLAFIPFYLNLLPSSYTFLFCYMLLWPGVAMSCPAIQTALAQQPQVASAAQPNTTAAGPARPMSNSFFSECTKVWRIIFSYSSEAPGVGSLALRPTQAHFLHCHEYHINSWHQKDSGCVQNETWSSMRSEVKLLQTPSIITGIFQMNVEQL